MNKILWKNLIWNYTTRLWYCWKYRKSRWCNFFIAKRLETAKQEQEFLEKFKEAFKNTKIKGMSMGEYYGVSINENKSEQLNQTNSQSNNSPQSNTPGH